MQKNQLRKYQHGNSTLGLTTVPDMVCSVLEHHPAMCFVYETAERQKRVVND